MNDASRLLQQLQERAWKRNGDDPLPGFHECIAVCPTGALYDVDFFGDPFGETYADLLETLASPVVAARLRSLTLRGPDEGANGTRNWDLRALVAGRPLFPALLSVDIQQSQPGDHNRTIVGESYDEDGVLALLLTAAPLLRSLVSPSAPSAEFFQVGQREIRVLNVDAGYATQDFIVNLARSSCFPALYALEWGEYAERYLDDYAARVTPIEQFRELFASPAFHTVRAFTWRNPALTDGEIGLLRSALDRRVQFKVIRASSSYVT